MSLRLLFLLLVPVSDFLFGEVTDATESLRKRTIVKNPIQGFQIGQLPALPTSAIFIITMETIDLLTVFPIPLNCSSEKFVEHVVSLFFTATHSREGCNQCLCAIPSWALFISCNPAIRPSLFTVEPHTVVIDVKVTVCQSARLKTLPCSSVLLKQFSQCSLSNVFGRHDHSGTFRDKWFHYCVEGCPV